MKTIKHEIDFDLMASLMRGEIVILLGSNNQPNVELFLNSEEISLDIEGALDKLRDAYEW